MSKIGIDTRPVILIIDDEPSICQVLSFALEGQYRVLTAVDAVRAEQLLENEKPDLVLLDLQIGAVNGIDVLRQIKERDASIAVIMMTAYGSIRSSVEAMRLGAFTYLTKPLDIEELQIFIENALAVRSLSLRVARLNDELDSLRGGEYHGIIGQSKDMLDIFTLIERLKNLDTSVTITGESGTGKELVARAIHGAGERGKARFVAVNCAAIPDGLLEEELFGHKRGSFTGAISDRMGKLEMAQGGTLFLDEIGDMSVNLQSKLLRVLQEREYSPVGSNEIKKLDIRIIAATNRNLPEMIAQGAFRADLFYRLNVVEIHIPPLRDRKQDIPLLCKHFLSQYIAEGKCTAREIDASAMRVLLDYNYPGNVRELANLLEYAAVVCDRESITVNHLPARLLPERETEQTNSVQQMLTSMTLDELEKRAILACYEEMGGKQKLIAEHLGISERGLRNKLYQYGVLVRNGD